MARRVHKTRETPAVCPETLPPKNKDSLDCKQALLVFVVVSGVYVYTAYESISGGDSGELAVTCCQLSVAHPPGYPTFTLLGHLFIRIIPFGSPAWRINVFSAICGAFASMFLNLSMQTVSSIAALPLSFIYSFSYTIWLYSIQAEVFALNNLLTCLLIFLTVMHFRSERVVWALIGSFVCGLAATNQHTSIFIIVPVVFFVVFERPKTFLYNPQMAVALTTCFLVGISPYLHLPIASLLKRPASWGDHRTWEGFLTHFFRKEYGTFQLAAKEISKNPPLLVHKLQAYGRNAQEELSLAIVLLAILGLAYALFQRLPVRKVGILCLLSSYLLYILVFHYLANLDLSPLYLGVVMRFWQQPNAFVFFFAACGCAFLQRHLLARFNLLQPNIALMIGLLSISGFQVQRNFVRLDMHNVQVFREFGTKVIGSFPNNSIVLLNGDLFTNIPQYFAQCEGLGTNRKIEFLSIQLMTWPWFNLQQEIHSRIRFPGHHYHPFQENTYSMKSFLDSNYKRHSIFVIGGWKYGDRTVDGFYELIPYGIARKVVRTGKPLKNFNRHIKSAISGIPSPRVLGKFDSVKYPPESWEKVVYDEVFAALDTLSAFISQKLSSSSASTNWELLHHAGDLTEIVLELDEIGMSDRLDPKNYRNFGIYFGLLASNSTDSTSIARYNEKMMFWWKRYLKFNTDADIASYVQHRFNPYRGSSID